MRRMQAILMIVIGLAISLQAVAYVGPGAGITMLGALWAVILAVLSALLAVLYWPIRTLLRRRRQAREQKDQAGGNSERTD